MTQDQTPSLRFPEFRGAGAWAVKKLGEVCEINPSTKKLPEDFFYIDLGAVNSGNLISKKKLHCDSAPSRAQRLLKSGDIIYQVVRPYQRNNFLCNFDDKDNYVASTGYAQLRALDSNNFLYQLIHTDSFVNIVIAKCKGSNYPAISSSDLSEINISIPLLAEQEKIAECLLSLDEVIMAQGDRLDGLKDYKRGLMQQLFPAKGQTTPTRRFREFQGKDSWQATKLGEAFNLYQPQTLSRTALNQNGKYNVYGANGIIGRHNKYNHENSEVIVTCRGATCGEIHYTEPKVWITGNAMVVNPKDNNLSKRFILYYLKNRDFKHVISGSAQPQITREGFAPLPIALPPLAEQEKIADCLHSVDESITIQEQQLELLKKHKNGLMQQLFPTH